MNTQDPEIRARFEAHEIKVLRLFVGRVPEQEAREALEVSGWDRQAAIEHIRQKMPMRGGW